MSDKLRKAIIDLMESYEGRKRKIDIEIAKLQAERSAVEEHRLDLIDLLEKGREDSTDETD